MSILGLRKKANTLMIASKNRGQLGENFGRVSVSSSVKLYELAENGYRLFNDTLKHMSQNDMEIRLQIYKQVLEICGMF